MTLLAFDDIRLQQAEISEDRGVREAAAQSWLLYDDFHVHPIEISDGMRRDIARWVLFPHSDLEFEWPSDPPGLAAWNSDFSAFNAAFIGLEWESPTEATLPADGGFRLG